MTLSEKARQETPEQRVRPLRVLSSASSASASSMASPTASSTAAAVGAQLLVHEIYASIQGESTWAGVPCSFVRLTGCHLRCGYCDTEHAFHEGTLRSVDDVVAAVAAAGIPLVELTGGEPLLQPASSTLITRLLDAGHTVLVETSGAVTIEGLDPRVRLIVDIKTPGSGEAARNRWANLPLLKPGLDELKLVIVDDADYAWARDVVATRPIPAGVTVLFSPCFPTMAPQRLAEKIIQDRLPVRFQLQMHKVLWGEKTGV